MKRTLHIALIGPLPPPAGGMAHQTEQLARLLAGDGHQVKLVRSNAPYRPAWARRVPWLRALARLLPYLHALWRAMSGADVAHVMANSGWSWHVVAAPAVWVAWLRRVPCVVNYRGGDADAFLQRTAVLVRPTLRRAAVLIVPSGFLQQVFARHSIAAEIVPNVIDLARFTPCAEARGSKAPRLVVTRHLEPIYDVATALRAFALLRRRWPQAQLTIAGDGPQRATLERLAAELEIGTAVEFVGNVSHEAVRALIARADLMLNASRTDNMPNALLEALASGVPVVSTGAGGIPFIVEHEHSALLVDAGDAPALAAAAERVLADPDLAQRLRANGLTAVRRYTWDSVRARLYQVYARGEPGLTESLS
jgi:glycosyltransferase involved in cell wall biosynthesis